MQKIGTINKTREILEKNGFFMKKKFGQNFLIDQNILSANIQDLYQTYKSAKTGNKQRIRGPLCDYCAYQDLCNLDFYLPDDSSREIIINKIKKSS